MALVRHPGSPYHWVDISVPVCLRKAVGKARIRESTGTTDKKAAQEYHDKIKADLWRAEKLGEKPKVTLRQAIDRWKKHAAEKRLRAADDVLDRLEWWAEQLGEDTPVADIKRQDVMKAVEGMECRPNRFRPDTAGKLATPATINRYLQAMRGLLKKCAGEWEIIDAAPTITLRKESNGRVRAITMDQIKTLIGALPAHWRPIVMFSFATGLRKSNVLRLRWDQIDLERRRLLVGSEDFKQGVDFGMPLNDTALEILRMCQGEHKEFVFTYEGGPMAGLQHRTWKKALTKAGITDFRYHDARHTWATMLIESGADLETVRRLGGWESAEMVRRYAHYRTEHLRGHAKRLDGSFAALLPSDGAAVVEEALGS